MEMYKHHDLKLIPLDERQRFRQILRNIPSFYDYKSLLYIGVASNRFQFQNYLKEFDLTLLEAHAPNLEKYAGKYLLLNEDITKFETEKKWDVVMWWHGPEHVSKKELEPTLKKLEGMANELVILGCPWGKCLQGVFGGNPYQVHKNHIHPPDLLNLGYSVETIGRVNFPGSNILSWKVIKND